MGNKTKQCKAAGKFQVLQVTLQVSRKTMPDCCYRDYTVYFFVKKFNGLDYSTDCQGKKII